eukprot:1748320-Rhodomonas_salina.1
MDAAVSSMDEMLPFMDAAVSVIALHSSAVVGASAEAESARWGGQAAIVASVFTIPLDVLKSVNSRALC